MFSSIYIHETEALFYKKLIFAEAVFDEKIRHIRTPKRLFMCRRGFCWTLSNKFTNIEKATPPYIIDKLIRYGQEGRGG